MDKVVILSAVKVWENRVDQTLRNLVQLLPKTELDLNLQLTLRVNQVMGKTSNMPLLTNKRT